jgi:hypothetical protein
MKNPSVVNAISFADDQLLTGHDDGIRFHLIHLEQFFQTHIVLFADAVKSVAGHHFVILGA